MFRDQRKYVVFRMMIMNVEVRFAEIKNKINAVVYGFNKLC